MHHNWIKNGIFSFAYFSSSYLLMMAFHKSVYGYLLNCISYILIHFLIAWGCSSTRFIYGSCNIIQLISKIGRSIVAVFIYRSFLCEVIGWAMILYKFKIKLYNNHFKAALLVLNCHEPPVSWIIISQDSTKCHSII